MITDTTPLRFFSVRINENRDRFLVAMPTMLAALEYAVANTTPRPIKVEIDELVDGNDPSLNSQLGREEP